MPGSLWNLECSGANNNNYADVYQVWKNSVRSSGPASSLLAQGKQLVVSLGWYFDSNCYDWADCWETNPLKTLRLNPSVPGLIGGEACAWDFSEEMWLFSRVPYRALAALAGKMWEVNWLLYPRAGGEVGYRIGEVCKRAVERGVVPVNVCMQSGPLGSLFDTEEYQINRHEQEARMCQRMQQL
jgi:hypothetical protein